MKKIIGKIKVSDIIAVIIAAILIMPIAVSTIKSVTADGADAFYSQNDGNRTKNAEGVYALDIRGMDQLTVGEKLSAVSADTGFYVLLEIRDALTFMRQVKCNGKTRYLYELRGYDGKSYYILSTKKNLKIARR
ncbi:hypothetical protein DXC24_13100 [Clostridium sp. OM08-29]|jgi:hypothetical protein|nr:hypothetical protein DXC24_13100 [Clostridium sp. OM08-29]